MTNEEAIAQLKFDKDLYETENCRSGDGTPDGDLMFALDMAISALRAQEKEPCEFCGRGKPIKAFTVLQPSRMQYGTSVKAVVCLVRGRPPKGE